jgi:hypothetical protein
MFAQIIRGRVSDPTAIDGTFSRWAKELAPGAKGWLGTTGGATEDGELFIMVRFESEEAARANSERPEQDQFWSETSKLFDGEPTFQDSNEVYVEAASDLDSARFVQIVMSQVSDPERSRKAAEATLEARQAHRPEILGSVVVAHGEGKFTMAVYFTDEAAAREGEKREVPAEFQETMKEMMAISVGVPQFLNLKTPWLDSPK